MAAITRSRSRSAVRALPRGWTIVGLAGLSWAGLVALANAATVLFQFILASL